MNILLSSIILTACASAGAAVRSGGLEIVPGAIWHDDRGEMIQAHGGGILKHGDAWYWYGEDKRNGYYPSPGVACYSSTDLVNWKYEKIACSNWVQNGNSIVPNTPEKFRSGTKLAIIERPKVLYNERTGKFVMWMHLEGHTDDHDVKYQLSSAGVAVSDSPAGPFKFAGLLRPVPPELHREYSQRSEADQFERGSTFRDMTLFKDDDGKAYVVYAAESNYTMHIAQLTDDYCGVLQPAEGRTWSRILVDHHREAPALFKHDGRYYLLTSGCTGWKPGEARLYVSQNVLGPYENLGNPCRGAGFRTTFDSQVAFVLPVDPERGRFMFMADRWNPKGVGESTYVWLPLTAGNSDEVTINWTEKWEPKSLKGTGIKR